MISRKMVYLKFIHHYFINQNKLKWSFNLCLC